MWTYFVLISLLPFVLLCTDQKYENYAYEDLCEFQSNYSLENSWHFSADLAHQSLNQTSSTFSSDIFFEPINNYQHQEKLLEYSMQ
jgi:hypothetical protein